jgi:UDP-N-acetylglucosamine 2-epimerase (non-hydrolysing)
MKRILIIVGTRPNFIKVTQFKRVAEDFDDLEVRIVHTGQHFDKNMSEVFFTQFGLQPDYFLNIGVGSPNTQMAKIMLGLEELIRDEFRPDLLIVPGDVNSTFAAALTANKMGIKLAHLESGLRSFDRDMPEEINRILTDEIADHYFITEQSGVDNLKKEMKNGKLHLVGNTMIDTLVAYEDKIESCEVLSELNLTDSKFVLMTIHRPSNVDSVEGLRKLFDLIRSLAEKYKVVFPIHPRTTARMKEYDIAEKFDALDNLHLLGPMGYFEFQKLIKHAAFVLTDSGGIQEESTYRRVPCLTLRENTERPSTVDIGTNTLVNFDVSELLKYIGKIEDQSYKMGEVPPLWDGNTTQRILDIIREI